MAFLRASKLSWWVRGQSFLTLRDLSLAVEGVPERCTDEPSVVGVGKDSTESVNLELTHNPLLGF